MVSLAEGLPVVGKCRTSDDEVAVTEILARAFRYQCILNVYFESVI